MSYNVMEIYKDLPRTNCGYCGKPGCLPFAAAVYLEDFPLSACPHLEDEARAGMEARLAEERARGGGVREESVVQALAFLMERIVELDFKEMAARSGSEYEAGPPESLMLEVLGSSYRISREGVSAFAGPEPGVTAKVFMLIYVTQANGAEVSGRWAAFRELPNTVSKSAQFEGECARLARSFSGRMEALIGPAERLGGRRIAAGNADLAFEFQALPRVGLQLLFWDGDDDFEARSSILVDKGVLDYLDQEALVFLAELLVGLLLGEDVSGIVV